MGFKYSLEVSDKSRQIIRNRLYENERLKGVTVSNGVNGLDIETTGDNRKGPAFDEGVIFEVIVEALKANGNRPDFKLTSYSINPELERLRIENQVLAKEVEDKVIKYENEKKASTDLLQRLGELDEGVLVEVRRDPVYGFLEYLRAQAPKIIPVYNVIEQMIADPVVGSDLRRIRELYDATLIDAIRELELPPDILRYLNFDPDVENLISGNPNMEPDDFKNLRTTAGKSRARLNFLNGYENGIRSNTPVFDEAIAEIINKEKEKETVFRFETKNRERTSAIDRVRQMAKRHAKIKTDMSEIGGPISVEYGAIVRPVNGGTVLEISTPCAEDGFVRKALAAHIGTVQEVDGVKMLDSPVETGNLLTRIFSFQERDRADEAVKKLLENYEGYDPFTLGLKLLMHYYKLLK